MSHKRTQSPKWSLGVQAGVTAGGQVMTADANFKRASRDSRTPAPLNWASYRPMLAEMLEARERILKIAEAYTSDGAGAEAVTFALRASSEYILELLRCIETRPQGKGGWQRAARLDALLAQVEAALGGI